LGHFNNIKKTAKNNRPIGEASPNLVTLAWMTFLHKDLVWKFVSRYCMYISMSAYFFCCCPPSQIVTSIGEGQNVGVVIILVSVQNISGAVYILFM
jgi:hypothetical protein